jgi:hypothetical protein
MALTKAHNNGVTATMESALPVGVLAETSGIADAECGRGECARGGETLEAPNSEADVGVERRAPG